MKKYFIIPVLVVFMTITPFLYGSVFIFAGEPTREELEQELADIQKQIDAINIDLGKTQAEKRTLTNRVNYLRGEQSKLSLQIDATSLLVDDYETKMRKSVESIDEVNERISILQAEIGALLWEIYQENERPLFEVFISDGGFAEYYESIKEVSNLSSSVSEILGELVQRKEFLEVRVDELDIFITDTEQLLGVQSLQRDELVSKTNEQRVLLDETKGEEATYQESLAAQKKRANEIRYRIYEVLGVSQSITFEEALEVANWASSQTGVRPAFLLSILTQESNLGRNVGTCNRIGDPPEKGWRTIMKPTRDQEPFLVITGALGLDPDTTPVSCPWIKNGKQIGWGGAMGPAQFIPSTWIGYQDRLRDILGKPPNPWDIRDAFLASALLLRDNGAARGGENEEWKAALRYFSGSVNTAYSFYGDQVLKRARGYQEDIDLLNQ